MPDTTAEVSSDVTSKKPKERLKSKRSKKTKAPSKTKSTARVIVSAEQLPRKSLEQVLRVPKVLREVFAGGPTTWLEIAKALKVAPNPMNKYYLWSAQAYNLIEKEDEKFSLSELGVAQTCAVDMSANN